MVFLIQPMLHVGVIECDCDGFEMGCGIDIL